MLSAVDGGTSSEDAEKEEQRVSAGPQSLAISLMGVVHAKDTAAKGQSERSKSSECSAADSMQAVDLPRRKSAPPIFVVKPGAQTIQVYKVGELTTLSSSADNIQSWMEDLLCPADKDTKESSNTRA